MQMRNNERGSVIVFVTLIITLLLIMVGMGLDTGQLTYVRSQGQAAVDAAALAAASGLPVGAAEVTSRVSAFNSTNDYVESPTNPIGSANITYIQYNPSTGAITDLPSIAGANGVRVALEQNNPYTGVAPNSGITTPVFLTRLLNLFGMSAPTQVDVSVSAVAAITAIPGIPIALYQSLCDSADAELLTAPSTTDNSCWTTYWEPSVNTPNVQALFQASQECSGLPRGGVGTDPIYLGNGVNVPVYDAAKDLFDAYPGKCWLVPVVPDGSPCNRTDDIVDWARMCPTEVNKHGSPKYIRAKVTCGQSPYGSQDSLCFAARLLRDTKSGM